MDVQLKQSDTGVRNQTVDSLRGFAMLMVILGHTLTGITSDSQESLLFNIIWSLQMPMFILISGYVTQYSRPIKGFPSYINFLKKRTFSYLVPWVVWTIFVRGILLGQNNFLNLGWMIYHMDSGYWFLVTIWTISTMWGTAQFIGATFKGITDDSWKYLAIVTIIYGGLACCLALLGLIIGLSFLCIKLTLYYIPFYYLGALYGWYRKSVPTANQQATCVNLVVAGATCIYVYLITRFNLYTIADNIPGISIRIMASVAGCIVISSLGYRFFARNERLAYVGIHSLEIYVIHSLFTSLIKIQPLPVFSSVTGMLIVLGNYVLTVALTVGVTVLLNENKYLKMALFGVFSK